MGFLRKEVMHAQINWYWTVVQLNPLSNNNNAQQRRTVCIHFESKQKAEIKYVHNADSHEKGQ